jgi:PadR family transcriptional regulator PadR
MYFPVSSTLIEFLILSMLEKHDSYGYEISQTIKLVTNARESSLYPILKKLVVAHFVTTYNQEHQGRQRKYYAITESGRFQLGYLREEWQRYKDTLDGIIEGRIRHDAD